MQDKDIKIAVLTGGDSSERSVALQSAKNVLASLRKRYNVKVFDFPNSNKRDSILVAYDPNQKGYIPWS